MWIQGAGDFIGTLWLWVLPSGWEEALAQLASIGPPLFGPGNVVVAFL